MSFVTFELDASTGDVANVQKLRTFVPRQLPVGTWRVTLDEDTVTIHGEDGGVAKQLGTGRWSGSGIRERAPLRDGVPEDRQWSLVENALREYGGASAVRQAPPSSRTSSRTSSRRTPFPKRYVVAAVLASSLLLVFASFLRRGWHAHGGFPLDGAHRIIAPLVLLLAVIAIAYATVGLGSPAVSKEPWRYDSTGARKLGPLASRFSAILTVGVLMSLYPMSLAAFSKYGVIHAPSPEPSHGPPVAEPASMPTPTPAPEPVVPRAIEEQLASATSVTAGIALAKPRLGNGADHPGVALLARYVGQQLVLADVKVAEPETTLPLVLKDADLERGKRLCVSGKLTDIERKDLDGRPTYHGALVTSDEDVVRFVAVGSTGTLVKRSAGTLCGIVTGTADKAAMVVGMFDLPENVAPAVER